MADENAFFVQFPHPGGEHNSPTDDMPWNTGDHRRKFLVAPGLHIDGNDRTHKAELAFWGEWEPPSRVVRRWPRSDRLPRALHRPYWANPASNAYRQNTDPWVWGPQMIYSNCKQVTGPERRPTSMQGLTRGSVICFGSTVDHEFCVDTVFVIASAEPWVPASAENLDVEDAFKICTGVSITTSERDAHLPLTLYRGATVEDPIDGMFSFVPARRADADDARFLRPPLCLPGLINPASRQSTWGSKRPLPIGKIRTAWETVCQQVLASDLVLAVQLQTPTREGSVLVVPESARQRC